MKIGIITYHFARNYGAILQCYALQSYLNSLEHTVEVLNYESARQERNNSLHHKRDNPLANLAVNAALLPFERKRRSKEKGFSSFEDELLSLSPRLRTLADLSSYVNSSSFDLLISGSDQVFNPKIDDFDEAFLFPFETSAKKCSFAASLGSATATDLRSYANPLKSFDVLSVRESSDVPIIEKICGRTPTVVDDPVFLLEPEEWASVASDGEHSGDYVLGYFINKTAAPSYLRHAKAVASRLGLPLKVINVRFSKDSFRREMITDASPADFLALFSNASFVCTDSFHGSAFSLIFKKPFISFEPKGKSSDWRKRDLLNKAGEGFRSVSIDDDCALEEVLRISTLQAPHEGCLDEIKACQAEYIKTLLSGD